jgi:ABC-2 type transport system ATP-binding protein
MLIQIEGVFKSFGKQTVLRDISLDIAEQEIFGLIGPSGAGKTTLIRVITGALTAEAGEIRLDGERLPSFTALKQIGYMAQGDALYPDLSGRDNLRFFGGMYGLAKRELNQRTDEMLRLLDLSGDAKKLVANYSGGMKKRLSLAVALLHRPRLLLLDEPTVGIDPLLRRRVWDEFRNLRDSGATIVVTTHVMDEAVNCDRLALIYEGGILANGTVAELLASTTTHSLDELFFCNGVVS